MPTVALSIRIRCNIYIEEILLSFADIVLYLLFIYFHYIYYSLLFTSIILLIAQAHQAAAEPAASEWVCYDKYIMTFFSLASNNGCLLITQLKHIVYIFVERLRAYTVGSGAEPMVGGLGDKVSQKLEIFCKFNSHFKPF